MRQLNKYIDHTLLKPEATREDVLKLCREAIENNFYSVCVNSCYVALAAEELKGSGVLIAGVCGFPLGAMASEIKAFEAGYEAGKGASEIDMVINIGALKEGRREYVLQDIKGVVEKSKEYGAIVKVILETCLLTDEEVVEGCLISREAGAAFVKTSTGFSSAGATAHHVELMKKTAGNDMKVKASGGIRDRNKAIEMIEAGADRIGASASVAICK